MVILGGIWSSAGGPDRQAAGEPDGWVDRVRIAFIPVQLNLLKLVNADIKLNNLET